MTETDARMAAWDAGVAHARKHGRTIWNEDDFAEVVRVFGDLYPESVELPPLEVWP